MSSLPRFFAASVSAAADIDGPGEDAEIGMSSVLVSGPKLTLPRSRGWAGLSRPSRRPHLRRGPIGPGFLFSTSAVQADRSPARGEETRGSVPPAKPFSPPGFSLPDRGGPAPRGRFAAKAVQLRFRNVRCARKPVRRCFLLSITVPAIMRGSAPREQQKRTRP